MIVSMKKISVLCRREDRDETLRAIGDLGLLHVIPVRPPSGAKLEQARARADLVRRLLDQVPKASDAAPTGATPQQVASRVDGLVQRRRDLGENIDVLQRELQRIAPFGSFDPRDILDLRGNEVWISLHRADARDTVQVPEGYVMIPFDGARQTTYFALMGRRAPDTEYSEMALPEQSTAAMERELESKRKELRDCEQELATMAGDTPALREQADLDQETVAFIEVQEGMAEEGPVTWLRGYCPADNVDTITAGAARHGWGYLIEEPGDDEAVPTLIRNPRWVRIIKPVFDFIGINPGYHEVDISALFLVFFSAFFGMIVGDAGYGMLFLTATLLLGKKMKQSAPLLFPMLLVMSLCTMTWGTLTGVWFGMSSTPAVLDQVKVPWLTDPDNVMFLCFVIGACHLTIAHGWKALRLAPSPQALADVGWICSTWALFFVINNMVLHAALPGFAMPLLATGAVLVALFMTPLKKIKSEWFGHVMLPLDIISNFVDIISYVRLFAVGLATFAVGNAFNNMAIGDGISGVGSAVAAAVVLFLGHTLNIIMATMGVLVHGIRLNALEFSSHLGLEWSGSPFKPFTRTKRHTEH
jgi:V/A-type H+-transporting ATPase subunit I